MTYVIALLFLLRAPVDPVIAQTDKLIESRKTASRHEDQFLTRWKLLGFGFSRISDGFS